ncbi:hypothetical protein D3C79_1022570 [compost metagenome]
MLQDLELADRLTKLFAGFQVVERQLAGGTHAADGFSALRGNGAPLLIAQSGQRLTRCTEQCGTADHNIVQEQVTGLASVQACVLAQRHTRALRVD